MLGKGWPKLITAVAFFSTRSGRNARYGRDSFAVEALRRQFSKRVRRRAPGGSVGWPGGWWVRAPDDGRVVGVWSASSPGRGRDGLSLTTLRVLGFFSGGRHLQPTQYILPYSIKFASRLKLGRSCRIKPLKRLMTILEPPEPPRADRKAFTYRRKASKFDGRFSSCEENATAFLPSQGIRVFDEIQALRVYLVSCNHPDG